MHTRRKRNILKLRYRHVKRKIWRVQSRGRHQRQCDTKYWKTHRMEYWMYTGISLDDVFWERMEGYLQRIYVRRMLLFNINYTQVWVRELSPRGSYTVYMYTFTNEARSKY